MRKIFLIALIMILITGLIFGGCAKPAPTTQTPTVPTTPASTTLTPKYGGTLRVIGTRGGPTAIGWAPDMAPGTQGIVMPSLETLLRGDNKGNIVPWLAESYKVADDLKSITFNLRKGVKFHDGSDFNAEVVKWNLDIMINAKQQPYWASVDIIDDYTVRVNFTEWMNILPASFSDYSVVNFIVSKAAFDKNGVEWIRQNPVGTGPFEFVSFERDVNIKFVKNPDYWLKGKPYVDEFINIFIADPTTQKMAMQTGEADMVGPIALGKETVDYAALGLTVKSNPNTNCVLVPDTANADSPWANKKVREAVEYAVDREAIADAFGYGYWEAPYQLPARSVPIYNPNFTLGRKYAPEKAKQLLAEAGYPDGFKTTIIVSPGTNKDIAVALQADLAKVGIQVDLDYPESAKFMQMYFFGTWSNAAVFDVWPSDVNFNQPLQFVMNNISKSWLRTPELLQAFKSSMSTPSPDIEKESAVTDIMTRNALLIPIYEQGQATAMQPYVMDTGVYERLLQWNVEDVWLNK